MKLSMVVGAFEMQRELPRTLQTMSRAMQRGLESLDYDIVVVDNGSSTPVAEVGHLSPQVKVFRPDPPFSVSPAAALNEVVCESDGELIGLVIDGARMFSPGVIRSAVDAYQLDTSKVIGTYGFHLGPDVQMRSVQAGYDQSVEDSMLEAVDWTEDGYRLFDVSVLAGSSRNGWFAPIAESNAIFMARELWDDLGGLDERFGSAGGGYVNLDFWKRAVELSENQPLMILGEGSFHQVHGGAATNGRQSDRNEMAAEYLEIIGEVFEAPMYEPQFVGRLSQTLANRFGGAQPSTAD